MTYLGIALGLGLLLALVNEFVIYKTKKKGEDDEK